MEYTMDETTGTMRTLKELPGPKGLPLLGNLLRLDFKQLHRVLERWCEEFGTLCAFKLGLRPVVVVADPELTRLSLLAWIFVYFRGSVAREAA
jgi:hypothetical protein